MKFKHDYAIYIHADFDPKLHAQFLPSNAPPLQNS